MTTRAAVVLGIAQLVTWGVLYYGSTPVIAAGAMIVAVGAGLITLVRPHLVQTLVGTRTAER